ncbi:MAG TPA: TetR/AcrR family transcriptional regulator C-terminal domain-containing protein [Mycolicibacillus parakoreensis]|uniref:TetR/AcrR family transcriptional regulator n=1 Tax=Mycolicibacillus parakoreensis TaxID=1069221 RepID=UPI0021F3590C|nr:TetR/AcrR family transcriptional regulator C-terminal domain-containing protein [Mycolicibacillus parakoreensis]HLR99797.1 TetR/AcrR family transcriptional regulator C-terminal domain-containing protein [Mycolicibacillus parakoreensis]
MHPHKHDPRRDPSGELDHSRGRDAKRDAKRDLKGRDLKGRDLKGDVVEAAVRLLDRYGIADLSMRRLARELDLTPGALYWHFADKQALLGAVTDRLLAPVDTAAPARGWRERIEALCRRLRDALLSHTDGAELVSASLAAGRSRRIDEVAAALADAAGDCGMPPEQSALAARSILYYVLGFTVDEQSRRQWDAAGAAATVSDLAAAGPHAHPDRDFGFGLGLLIDGLAAHAAVALS